MDRRQRYFDSLQSFLPEQTFKKLLLCRVLQAHDRVQRIGYKLHLVHVISDTNREFYIYMKQKYESDPFYSIVIFSKANREVKFMRAFGEVPSDNEIYLLRIETICIVSPIDIR